MRASTSGEPLALEALHISKWFPGVHALDDVSLQVHPGHLVALLGENGAGKSTLMGVLTGALQSNQGKIFANGKRIVLRTPRDALAHGIACVFQELSLAPNLSVSENLFLGREPRTRFGLVDYARMRDKTAMLLAQMQVSLEPDARVDSLRVGQQQIVEIVRAISRNVRVLILDEPTSALSHPEAQSLLKLTANLKRGGVGIIYITHKFAELAELADDLVVLRDGKVVHTSAFNVCSHEDIVRLMIGRDRTPSRSFAARSAGAELLRAEQLSLPHPVRQGDYVVRKVDFTLKRGEVLGIFGLMGSGRTEMLEALFGVHSTSMSGSIRLNSAPIHLKSPRHAITAGIVLAPEDRKHDGLVLSMSVRDNASLALMHAASRWGLLSTGRQDALVRPLFERFRLKAHALDSAVSGLSGGNQQKVVLAKWLATRPQVILLDEPTRGVDVNAKAEIFTFIDELAREGLGVIFVSSDMEDLLALADRILVMRDGAKSAEFSRSDATPERLLQAALPLALQQGAS